MCVMETNLLGLDNVCLVYVVVIVSLVLLQVLLVIFLKVECSSGSGKNIEER